MLSAFIDKHLISEYLDFAESIKREYEINDQIETVSNAIKKIKEQLAALSI